MDRGAELRLRLAHAAVAAGDAAAARAHTLKLVDQGHVSACRLAAQLARVPLTPDTAPSDVQKLAAFALAHCAQSEVCPVLPCSLFRLCTRSVFP